MYLQNEIIMYNDHVYLTKKEIRQMNEITMQLVADKYIKMALEEISTVKISARTP